MFNLNNSYQLLGKPTTVGELVELLKEVPSNTLFGFRNQPMQELIQLIPKEGEVNVYFQEGDPADNWFFYSQHKPQEGIEVLAFSPDWIHPDFNPRGVRLGFRNGFGEFTTARWEDYQDHYVTEEDSQPTLWKEIGSTPLV